MPEKSQQNEAQHALDKARKLERHGMVHQNDKVAHVEARKKDDEYMEKKFGK